MYLNCSFPIISYFVPLCFNIHYTYRNCRQSNIDNNEIEIKALTALLSQLSLSVGYENGSHHENMPIQFWSPLPHFYIVKLGFTVVYISFLISAKQNRLWVLFRTEAVLTCTHNLCFEHKYENYQKFYLKTFIFLWWNFWYIWIGVFA